MNRIRVLRYTLPLVASILVAVAGCSKEEGTPVTPPPGGGIDTAGKKKTGILTLSFETTAGARTFGILDTMTTQGGVEYRVSSLKFFVSSPWMINQNGDTVRPKLLDPELKPLRYNVLLVDYADPATLALRLLTTAGTYKEIGFSVGVPVVGDNGDSLNHGDASLFEAPLDVDNGMYWSWNPGYIFLRIEGRVKETDGTWSNFFYHVGNDERFMGVKMADVSVPVDTSDASAAKLAVNLNRLFVDPFGGNNPDLAVRSQRVAQGGELATVLSRNVMMSGMFSIKR